jgi:CubicO group peptidase (beta-lactamase class C family)
MRRSPRMVSIALIGTWLMISAPAHGAQSPSDALSAKIKRTESSLSPSVHIKGRPVEKASLADRMAALKIPAVSVAVIKDGQIEWAKAYGFRDVEAKSPATPETLFQAASISKPVTAAAALHFVEKGLLGLDEDVNAKLVSWKVPENEFTAKAKVTLREILSHSAGLTVHGFPGYPAGAPLPTLLQVLDGMKPANTEPIRVNAVPGSRWSYSGGGYTVLQQLLIDVLGRPFPDILKDTVLVPAGMTLSTFNQPLPEARLAEAAVGYRSGGTEVEGRRHVYPELAAAGLWTTPSDLCRFAIEVMNAFAGRSDKILSQVMAKQMLTVQKAPSGLGVILEGQGADFRFGHSGGNEGFICDLVAFPATDGGAAVMTNSDSGGALCGELLRSIAAEYGWKGYEAVEKTIVPVASEVLDRCAGRYEIDESGEKTPAVVARKDDHLAINLMGSDIELFPESETRFFSMSQMTVVFVKDDRGSVTGCIVNGRYKAKKLD